MYAFCTTSHVILYKYETLQDFAINHVFFFFFFPYKFPYFWSIWSRDSNVKITSLSNRNELIYRRYYFPDKKVWRSISIYNKKKKQKLKSDLERWSRTMDRYKFSKELQTVTKNNVLFVLITCSIENSR